MALLAWAEVGKRFYETGVDRGVLYVDSDPGVAWSGIVSVDENPSGGDPEPYYIDGVKYLNLSGQEEYEATLSAFYSPDEFDACDGNVAVRGGMYAAQQPRKSFGLSYRTKIGNDTIGTNYGYKIHLVYNALAQPSQHSYNTAGDKSDVPTATWALTTTAVDITGASRSAHLVIDTTKTPPPVILALEAILYGTDVGTPRLPLPDEIAELFDDTVDFVVTDLTGGVFNIAGSPIAVQDLGGGKWQITSDTVVMVDSDTWNISSP